MKGTSLLKSSRGFLSGGKVSRDVIRNIAKLGSVSVG